MKRADMIWIAVVALVAVGCGDTEPPAANDVATRGAPTPAEVEPASDFDDYMLGSLPGPGSLVRDPFLDSSAPKVAPTPTVRRAPAPTPAPQLRGIIRSKGRLVALFDRGTAGQGESIRGWSVQSIDERSVTLQRHGRTVRRAL